MLTGMDFRHQVFANFKSRFGSSPRVYRAPGRVNLIGEHTDYNEGFVFPAAIGFSCWVAVGAREDRKLVLYSENFGASREGDLDDLKPAAGNWSDYPLGVAWGLEQAGYRLRGANLYLAGDVPLGAGLGSSAAIEVATGYALLVNAGQAMDRTELAQICQRGESEFVGARVGIMDQFVSCHGQAGHALLLDCRSLAYRAVRLPEQMDLVICNTKVKHQLQASGYNDRRAECEEAVRLLAKVLPEGSLRDLNMQQLTEHRVELSDTLYNRCRHVISENQRVGKMAEALESGETGVWKKLMAASHTSLRDDYQVSCRELDIMVEIAGRQSGIYGARMTGGGFGGCTINLVAKAYTPEFQERVSAEYQAATGLQPDVYVCEAAQGAESVEIWD